MILLWDKQCLSVYLTLVCIIKSLGLGVLHSSGGHEPCSIRFDSQHWGEKKIEKDTVFESWTEGYVGCNHLNFTVPKV